MLWSEEIVLVISPSSITSICCGFVVQFCTTNGTNGVYVFCHCFLSWLCTICVYADDTLAIICIFYCDASGLCVLCVLIKIRVEIVQQVQNKSATNLQTSCTINLQEWRQWSSGLTDHDGVGVLSHRAGLPRRTNIRHQQPADSKPTPNYTGWAENAGPQTNDHNSVKS